MMLETTLQFRGINSDIPPHEVPRDHWTSGQNIFFRDLATQRVWGYQEYFRDSPNYEPVFIYPLQKVGVFVWIIVLRTFGGTTEVRGYTGSGAGVTLGTLPTDPILGNWTATNINGFIVLNPGNATDPPQYTDGVSAGAMAPLPGWTDLVPGNTPYCKAIASYKYNLFAFAMGDTSASPDIPEQMLWSNSALPGAVPQEWVASASNDAGSNILAEPSGEIVGGLVLRDALAIYKNFSVHIAQFVGGNFVFGFRNLYISAGMLNRNCVVEVNGRHIVATQDDIIAHDGTSMESICTHEVRRKIFNTIQPASIKWCQMALRHPTDEVWFAYPDGDSKYCNMAAIYNLKTGRWGFRPLPQVTSLGYGLVNNEGFRAEWGGLAPDPDPVAVPGRDWPWEEDPHRWDEQAYSATSDEILFCAPQLADSTAGKVWIADRGFTNDGEPVDAEVVREDIVVDDNPETVKVVTEIWPHLLGRLGDEIEIQVGGSLYVEGPITWSGIKKYSIGQGVQKVDLFSVGRYHAFKFRTRGGAPWRLHSFKVRYKEKGRF